MFRSLICLIFAFPFVLGAETELWDSECYDENSQLQQMIARNFLDLLQDKMPCLYPQALLLDVGCGNGRNTRSILERYEGIRILGIDASSDMIHFANAHFGDAQVSFCVDRAENLQTIPPESVDAITSFSSLHWVSDQRSAYQRMYETLKPGGWAGLMFAADTGFDDPLDHAFAQAMQEHPWAAYFKASAEDIGWHNSKPETIRSRMEELGYQIVFMGVQNSDYPFENATSFRDWILASAQQLKQLPEQLQVSCAERIVELYLSATTHFQPLMHHPAIYRVDAFMVLAKKPLGEIHE